MSVADVGIVLVYSAMIMIIFMLTWLLVSPIKIVGRILVNSILGVFLLMAFNFFYDFTGVYIGVNETTSMTVGVLGVPGFVALLAAKMILL